MKAVGIIVAWLMVTPVAAGSTLRQDAPNVLYETMLDETTSAKAAVHLSSFSAFLTKAAQKQQRLSEHDFVRYLFTKIHKQYLKRYTPVGTLSDVFEHGAYHCLTGTMLMATALEYFNIEHRVIETNYHIFILASTNGGKVLLEVTDAMNGFEDTEEGIDRRLASYKAYTLTATTNDKVVYRFKFELFKPVSLDEMHGLMLYNQSLQAFNQSNWKLAIHCLEKANKLYSSERIDEFAQLLLLSLQHSSLDSAQKVEYIKSVFTIRQRVALTVASLN